MDLSVVIITYNSSKYISECLRSVVLELGNRDAELVLIDNKSDDNTLEIIRKFSESELPENISVRITANDLNSGYAPANNQGMKNSSGNCLLLLHPDVNLRQNSLKVMLDTLNEEPSLGMVAPQFLFPDGSIQPSCRRFPNYLSVIYEALGLTMLFSKSRTFNAWKMGDFDHASRREVDQPMSACVLLKREVLNQVGLMDEQFVMFFNDVDWCKRIKGAGWKIVFNPDATVEHVLGGSVKFVRSRMILRSHAGFYLYFQKHFRKPSQRIMNQIMGLILFLTVLPRIILNKFITLLRVG
ncbi:MAG: glycosyltransferase family 2 protein [Candidatus Marinimicrobia bacterium]|nr:glycosyltransferase family 2 protein [Candidatus Neomarinimicrobiota bacterium]